MPTTSPREFSSGPPEFPGLTEASVWIASSIRLLFSGLRTDRIAEMMPRAELYDVIRYYDYEALDATIARTVLWPSNTGGTGSGE